MKNPRLDLLFSQSPNLLYRSPELRSHRIMQTRTAFAVLGFLTLVRSSCAAKIISSNDDGWAEVNIRAFYDTLTSDGHSVVVSAPAENQSGTGQLEELVFI